LVKGLVREKVEVEAILPTRAKTTRAFMATVLVMDQTAIKEATARMVKVTIVDERTSTGQGRAAVIEIVTEEIGIGIGIAIEVGSGTRTATDIAKEGADTKVIRATRVLDGATAKTAMSEIEETIRIGADEGAAMLKRAKGQSRLAAVPRLAPTKTMKTIFEGQEALEEMEALGRKQRPTRRVTASTLSRASTNHQTSRLLRSTAMLLLCKNKRIGPKPSAPM